MKNKLITIGWTGTKRCYLNVPREEAVRRFVKSEMYGYETTEEIALTTAESLVEEFEFDDEFGAYDAWKIG